MSYLAYRILSKVPDFTEDPIVGIADQTRRDTLIGHVPLFAEWTGPASRALGFLYRFSTESEYRTLRTHHNRVKGKWKPFYLPSWQPDIELAAAASKGDTTITVVDLGFSELIDEKPDADKRVIFAYTTNGEFRHFFVMSATDDGANEILTLDRPLTFDLAIGKTILGFCHLVRMADDQLQFDMQRPGIGRCRIRAVSVLKKIKDPDPQTETVKSAAIGSMLAFETVTSSFENFTTNEIRNVPAKGPESYDFPQGTAFIENWTATIEDNGATKKVVLKNSDETQQIDSELYTETFESDHLAFSFDPVGTEVLAWAQDEETIRAKWFSASVEQKLDWEGTSPVAFNTFAIDGTVDAGTAEIAIFYLREGYDAIFCRIFSENFATERQVLQTPIAPLYLYSAKRNGSRIEITGMDETHRKAVWTSLAYQEPIVDESSAAVSLIAGTFEQEPIVEAPADDEAAAAVSINQGEYADLIVSAEAESNGAAASVQIDSGEYFDTIQRGEGADGGNAELVLNGGIYKLTNIPTTAASQSGAETTINAGSYALP